MKLRILLLIAAMVAVILPATAAQANSDTINAIGRFDRSGNWSEMAIAADGAKMIASSNRRSASIELRTCQNQECTRAQFATIVDNVYPLSNFDFAVGDDGLPVFVVATGFQNTSARVEVIKCTDVYCEKPKVTNELWFVRDEGGVGDVSIDVDHHDNPTVLFNTRHGSGAEWETTLVSCGSAGCDIRGNRIQTLGHVETHDVAIGADGLPVLALGAEGYRLMTLERCSDRWCSTRRSETIGGRGSHAPRIASDVDEITVVSVDRKRRAERTVCTATSCSDAKPISKDGVRAVRPNVAYAKPGVIVVSYTDYVTDGLWLQTCVDRCNSELLLSRDAGRAYTRVGITSADGRAYISFYDATTRRLALADIGVL